MPDAYTAVVSLDHGMMFRAVTTTGHELVMDAAAASGGEENGPRPTEVLLAALGGCTGMDVISLLRKMRQDVTAYEVRVSGDERAAEHPRIFTKITVTHVVRGRAIQEASVARAVQLSATKYCPISNMLDKASVVVHRYEILEEEPAAPRS